MLDVFASPPQGIQEAPHDPRLSAAGHQVALRAVNLSCATDERSLMQELMRGLSVPLEAIQSWDHVLVAMTQPEQPERYGVLLQGYRDFCYRQQRLCGQLDAVLTEAQRLQAAQGKQMYLLAAYAETDPDHF